MSRSYCATALPDSAVPEKSFSIIAPTDFAALMRAKEILGKGTAFALYEGDRFVIAYRPIPSLSLDAWVSRELG